MLLPLIFQTIFTTVADDCLLIMDHKDIEDGYFSTDVRDTGLENEDDPTANTYSIIGLFNDNEDLREQYMDPYDCNYKFKLIYQYDDGTNDTLIWTQKSWIADETIIGANLSQIPDQSWKGDVGTRFFGLALSNRENTYIDGTGSFHNYYYHSVGTIIAGGWGAGIPGDRVTQYAYSSSLCIYQPDTTTPAPTCATTTGAPTSETTTNAGTTRDTTTESPIIEPSILPTADPTTSQPTTAQPTTADDCVLIMEHKDITDGYFSTDLKDTGLENTYSIIGLFNDDEDLRDQYKDDDGNYKFKLIYGYDDDTTDTFIWTQTSWIADVNITGANLTQIPDQSGKHPAAIFYGLALSNSANTYLDGTGTQVLNSQSWWFHAVGSNKAWLGGIPADRWNYPAQSSSLCIYEPPTSTDCSILDIDAYLSDCSAVFQANELEDDAMEQEIESLDQRVTTIEEEIEQCGCSSSSASGLTGTFIHDKSPSVGTNVVSTQSKDTLIIALVLINIFTIIGGCYVCLSLYKSPRVDFMRYDKVDVQYEEETEES